MKKVIIVTLCFAIASATKICNVGGKEAEMPDHIDCHAFDKIGKESFQPQQQQPQQQQPGNERVAHELTKAFSDTSAAFSGHSDNQAYHNHRGRGGFLWDGFPFPPWMNWPPFPNSPRIRWRRRRRQRPRPRPPTDDIEECPDEGIKFISHPTNCEKYILCVEGDEVATLTCPSGQHFSRELRACTSAREAECEDFDWECPDEDEPGVLVFLPNEQDCNAYYVCMQGTPIPLTCPANLHWSIDLNRCTLPGEANCNFATPFACPDSGIDQLPNPNSCNEYFVCVHGVEVDQTCPNGMHFSPISKTCARPESAGCVATATATTSITTIQAQTCPETGVSYLPDVESCNKYMICVNGSPFEKTCPRNLHFNQQTNSCEQPNAAGCKIEGTPRSKRSIKPASECPATGVVTIPNRFDCEAFILCINGNALDRQCPPGLHFSPDTLACVHPDVAQCRLNACHPNDFGFLPNEDDCNAYYICFSGNQIPMRCPQDRHWSTDTNSCMDPDDAGCEDNENIECPATGIEQIPYPDDCEQYVLCVNGMEFVLRCAPGLHFSPSLRVCTTPELAECEDQIWKCPEDSNEIVFIPDIEDCNAYFLCWMGNQIPLRCPANTHWSIENNRCMAPEDAECPWADDEAEECPEEGVKSIEHPENCESYILCVNGAEIEMNCPPGMHFCRDIRSCSHPLIANCRHSLTAAKSMSSPSASVKSEDSCPSIQTIQEIVFRPNYEDCGSYYLCLEQKEKVLFSCAEGFHWDQLKNNCVPARRTNCVL